MADSTEVAGDSTGGEIGQDDVEVSARGPRRLALRRTILVGTALVGVGIGAFWLSRDRIADQLIAAELEARGLPATYEIESIGPNTQVLRHVVIGNPSHPDLTIDRVEVTLAYGLGLPQVHKVSIFKPRAYGRYVDGRLSFGSLDPVLFGPDDGKPFKLPELDVALVDGRAVMDTDVGRVNLAAQGSGVLRSGFKGTLTAGSQELNRGDCRVARPDLSGRLSTEAGHLAFSGPVKAAWVRCGQGTFSVQSPSLQIDSVSNDDFSGLNAKGKLRGNALVAGSARGESVAIDGTLSLSHGIYSGRVTGNAGGLRVPGASFGLLGMDGLVRARDGFSRVEFRGAIDGQGLRRGAELERALASAEQGGRGSLISPIVAQIRRALKREERGSRITGELNWRQQGGTWSLVVPQARLRGGSGATLLAVSRSQITGDGRGRPRLAGNFSTGGEGLPRIIGTMESGHAGRALFRLTMAEYSAAGGSLAVPQMLVAQVGDGSFGFAGTARLSGAIPGGNATNLVLPVEGSFASTGALSLYRRCVTPSFDSLAIGNMVLERHELTVCPALGGAIVRSGPGGLQVAAGAPSLALAGMLGETPLRLSSGPVGLAWPGTLTASGVDVVLGPEQTAARFRLSDVAARLDGEFGGTFAGVEARLASVPLDVTNASGQWRYVDGRLELGSTDFVLSDRMSPARFENVFARGATLSLAENKIVADAVLREPASGHQVLRTAIRHDLGTGVGRANLFVEDLAFDTRPGGLQPAALTRLALGVVANVAGKVEGRGVIDWSPGTVKSSGRFTTDSLDLAAAFGPVKGLSGTLQFTDLLGLVTAPNQIFRVASVNPGIEVTDGIVDLALSEGQVLRLNKASWPFLGGTLTMEPTDLRLGVAEDRRYTLTIVGLDASRFLERMDLGNLSATGVFDGQLPLVFTSQGGRIVGGTLTSRAPGGNVAYVGTLSYENLGAMANFAFEALKSLDYRTMLIGMEGDLEGEVVTRVRFDGVKQGLGTRRNFITRQVASLPIQFNVNVRAPFYQLISSAKAMYDPAYIKDPRTLGLVDDSGRPLPRLTNGVRASGAPVVVLPNIQHAESGNRP